MTGRATGKLAKLTRLRDTFRNWPRVLLDHLGVARGSYTCEVRDGTSFEVRAGTDDRHVLFEIFVERIYDAPLAAGDIVVDIGANIGGFTVMAARRGARVVAFEPFPANFAALERNVRRNGLHATLVQAAVADADRTSEMFIPDDARFSGRYSLHPGRGGRTVEVHCISLDAVLARYELPRIDLLKIDCQGSEYEILFNASAETLARTRALIVECEEFPDRPEWSTSAMRAFLEAHGFSTSATGNLLRAARVGAPATAGTRRSHSVTAGPRSTEDFKTRDASSYDVVMGEFEQCVDRFSPLLAARVVELARISEGDRVLDVGAGTGIVSLAAARAAGPRGRVLGIDLSQRMVQAAAAKAAQEGLADRASFQEMDAERLAVPDASFDAVTSLFALLHFPDPFAALREQLRVLVPGGRMVLAVGSRPPLLSASGLTHRVAYVPKLIAQMRGMRLVAPMLLDDLVERRFPRRKGPEQAALAGASRKRTASVVSLVRRAGFTAVRTHWEGYEEEIQRIEDFWAIQRTFSSMVRKRLEGRSDDDLEALRAEFFERCREAQARGATLIYPFAAFYVSGDRPRG